jgi:hypothetical protein
LSIHCSRDQSIAASPFCVTFQFVTPVALTGFARIGCRTWVDWDPTPFLDFVRRKSLDGFCLLLAFVNFVDFSSN